MLSVILANSIERKHKQQVNALFSFSSTLCLIRFSSFTSCDSFIKFLPVFRYDLLSIASLFQWLKTFPCFHPYDFHRMNEHAKKKYRIVVYRSTLGELKEMVFSPFQSNVEGSCNAATCIRRCQYHFLLVRSPLQNATHNDAFRSMAMATTQWYTFFQLLVTAISQ